MTARLPINPSEVDTAIDLWLQDRSSQPLRLTINLPRPWLENATSMDLDVDVSIIEGALSARLNGTTVDLAQPVLLNPVSIAKPWGREIWYSGIEARGESQVQTAQGALLPLSQFLALAPRRLHQNQPVTLLKVLDPYPQSVTGDLYFEVHQEKREVYVVTAVDPAAWPDGKGRIRFGMNQSLRRKAGSDQAFRQAFLVAVQKYESIRRNIDAADSGGVRIDPAVEREARAAYEAFTDVRALETGDVVVVPTWTPHSLQHGVRVVEFQSPTYERYIIAFAQKVLTQSHWDSEFAIANMSLDTPEDPLFERLNDQLERIARFDHFNVCRGIASAQPFLLPSNLPYALIVALDRPLCVGGLILQAEQAALIPHVALQNADLRSQTQSRYLAAAPGL